jgi:hypothetical protein
MGIRLAMTPLRTADDACVHLQTAIGIEFATLPPYLYAKFSILPGTNPIAADNLSAIVGQEMIHFCLACNILNALGGDPVLKPPVYPGTIPGDIGKPGEKPLEVRILPFSRDAMAQGMAIEEPAHIPDFPHVNFMATTEDGAPQTETIGQFYTKLDKFLSTLPDTAWYADRNQIDDAQYFAGQLFPVNCYGDAHVAIEQIMSEGEGTGDDPLDFQGEVAHFYRFGEIFHEKVLTKADNKLGYSWGPEPLLVDYDAVYPAIKDPGSYDFSGASPAAQAAQAACNLAYRQLVDALQLAVTGEAAQLGIAVKAMFDLRMAAMVALTTPLDDSSPAVSGPSFVYTPTNAGASA